MGKKLYRSRSDRLIAGVCGGLGEYLNIDPVWLRLFFLLLLFAWGIGFWAYIVLWLIVPQEGREMTTPGDTVQANLQDIADRAREFGQSIQLGFQDDESASGAAPRTGPLVVGVILILLGGFLLLNQLNVFSWLRWDLMFSLLIIFVGGALLISHLKE
jgi:phage shock protein C